MTPKTEIFQVSIFQLTQRFVRTLKGALQIRHCAPNCAKDGDMCNNALNNNTIVLYLTWATIQNQVTKLGSYSVSCRLQV